MSLIIDFIFRRHLQEQEDTLKKLMENRQIQQMKELDTLFEKYVVVLSIIYLHPLKTNYYLLLESTQINIL